MRALNMDRRELIYEMSKYKKEREANGGKKNLDADVFSLMAGEANDMQWFMFENRIREIV